MAVNNNSPIISSKEGQRPQFWRVIMRTCQVAAGIDVIFFFLFHSLGSSILGWVNIFSIMMYSFAYYALKNRQTRIATTLIWTEVMLHAALGIILIGWNSGFHYYLLMFIPAICLSSSYRVALLSLVALFLFYVGLDFLTWFIEPVQPINPFALNIVHVFNLSAVFIMFSYLSFFYLKTVRQAQKKLRIMAETDPLTELFNRRHMSYLGEKEARRFDNSEHLVCLMLIDVDHFKTINDEYGHKVGDDVLVQISRIMRDQVRNHDLVSRWGGEEFLIILPGTNTEDAMCSAERIRKAFLNFDWLGKIGKKLSPTISVGVTELRQSETISAAIARADRALYRGKSGGRNRVEYGNA